jgi:5-methylcytosine-specific restriction endonuclease McrA
MPRIEPYIPNPQEQHEDDLWIKSECYRFYVKQRQLHCTFKQIMDLWLLAPYCTECALSDPFESNRFPDILPNTWESDLLLHVGQDTLNQTQQALSENPGYYFLCKHCGKELRPWQDSEIYVISYHLEEHYGIPLETPRKKNPSKKLRKQIIKLYNNKCFACDLTGQRNLNIDHLIPQSAGGDSAFRNLQPLCESCSNLKGNKLPKEIEVYSTIYFEPYPSDSYEGLFW